MTTMTIKRSGEDLLRPSRHEDTRNTAVAQGPLEPQQSKVESLKSPAPQNILKIKMITEFRISERVFSIASYDHG